MVTIIKVKSSKLKEPEKLKAQIANYAFRKIKNSLIVITQGWVDTDFVDGFFRIKFETI